MSQWSKIPTSITHKIKGSLGTEFDSFQKTCEEVGLVKNNFLPLMDTLKISKEGDQDFGVAMMGSALVSAANHYGGNGHLAKAKQLAQWALKLEPNHVPAIMCLSTIAEVEGDRKKVESLQKASNEIMARIRLKPEDSRTAFEQGLIEAAR